MRLINTNTLELEEFQGNQVPPYAILSHTWGSEEVSFQEWQNGSQLRRRWSRRWSRKEGLKKILNACRQARKDTLNYLWCDTNCIDKYSSAELSEAINSMFSWYRGADVCYAYLADVIQTEDSEKPMSKSRWFTRGWTLQELLAPKKMVFYDATWSRIGTKTELYWGSIISSTTGISLPYLVSGNISSATIAEKMSWLAKRTTTRVEDMAYCMLGIFGLNMPLLYGEGSRAFVRLQEELIKISNDQTIFCWTWFEDFDVLPDEWGSLLAPYPKAFMDCDQFKTIESTHRVATYAMTNAGLSIQMPYVRASRHYYMVLHVTKKGQTSPFMIPLLNTHKSGIWTRERFPPLPIPCEYPLLKDLEEQRFIVEPHSTNSSRNSILVRPYKQYGVLLTFNNPDAFCLDYDAVRVMGGTWDRSLGVIYLDVDQNPEADNRGYAGVVEFPRANPLYGGPTHLTISFSIMPFQDDRKVLEFSCKILDSDSSSHAAPTGVRFIRDEESDGSMAPSEKNDPELRDISNSDTPRVYSKKAEASVLLFSQPFHDHTRIYDDSRRTTILHAHILDHSRDDDQFSRDLAF